MSITNKIYYADNIDILKTMECNSVQLIYIDPPFNTSKTQIRKNTKMTKDSGGTRKGFKNTTYRVEQLSEHKYDDSFQDFWGFLRPRLIEAHRILKESGTLYLHLDYREIHYARIELDNIFGPENFLNEIIWAYDYGAKQKHKWPTKHDNILVYVKNASKHYFNSNSVNRETYRTPNLAPTKKDNLPMDVWWHTIVSPNSKEKTGYPTQKPSGILRRIISASSKKGDIVLDFFAGSGTTGFVAHELHRNFVLIDKNKEAIEIMKKRFRNVDCEFID